MQKLRENWKASIGLLLPLEEINLEAGSHIAVVGKEHKERFLDFG